MRKMPILLMVSITCCVLSGQTPASVTPTCPTMEVSIVADKSDGSARNISSDQGRLISLTEKPLLTIDDFTDANVSLTEGQIVQILDPITGKGFLIGPFRRDEAQKLADSINHRDSGCGPHISN
jgi:hypothetical protein